MLRELSESVLSDEVLDYAVAELADELERHFENLDSELDRLRQRKQEIEAEISRLVQAIAGGRDGRPLQSVMAAITEARPN